MQCLVFLFCPPEGSTCYCIIELKGVTDEQNQTY
jgi:hypothetical protein